MVVLGEGDVCNERGTPVGNVVLGEGAVSNERGTPVGKMFEELELVK
jgi:hypothetical protein